MFQSDHQTTDRPPKQLLRSDFHVQKQNGWAFRGQRVFASVAKPHDQNMPDMYMHHSGLGSCGVGSAIGWQRVKLISEVLSQRTERKLVHIQR